MPTAPETRPAIRSLPVAPLGTTTWRAVVSLAAVNLKTVTIRDSLLWGFDMDTSGNVTAIGPRKPKAHENWTHLHLLRSGKGTGPLSFEKMGWTFREAP